MKTSFKLTLMVVALTQAPMVYAAGEAASAESGSVTAAKQCGTDGKTTVDASGNGTENGAACNCPSANIMRLDDTKSVCSTPEMIAELERKFNGLDPKNYTGQPSKQCSVDSNFKAWNAFQKVISSKDAPTAGGSLKVAYTNQSEVFDSIMYSDNPSTFCGKLFSGGGSASFLKGPGKNYPSSEVGVADLVNNSIALSKVKVVDAAGAPVEQVAISNESQYRNIALNVSENLKDLNDDNLCNGVVQYSECRARIVAFLSFNQIAFCRGLQGLAAYNEFDGAKDEYTYQTLKCKKTGYYTADFKDCKTLVDLYGGAQVAEMGVNLGTQINEQVTGMNAANAIATATGNEQVAAIVGTQSVAIAKRNNEIANSAFQGTKSLTLFAALGNMANPNNIHEKCDSEAKACCEFVGKIYAKDLFINSKVSQTILTEAVKAGGMAVVSGVMANAYQNQYDTLEKVKDKLDQIETKEDYSGYGFAKAGGLAQLCQQNPSHPSCSANTNGSRQVVSGVSASNFSFAGGNNQDFSFGGNGETAFNPYEAQTASASGAKVDGALKSALAADAARAAGGFVDGNMSAARMVAGNGAAAAGAAGGAGGGGAAGGGPGLSKDQGAAQAAQAADDKAKLDIEKSGLSYSAAKGAKGARGGSFGNAEKANPFSDLFGAKSAASGSALKVEGSRGVASQDAGIGTKDGKSIFDKISGRYDQIEKDSRLLEYYQP